MPSVRRCYSSLSILTLSCTCSKQRNYPTLREGGKERREIKRGRNGGKLAAPSRSRKLAPAMSLCPQLSLLPQCYPVPLGSSWCPSSRFLWLWFHPCLLPLSEAVSSFMVGKILTMLLNMTPPYIGKRSREYHGAFPRNP